MSFFIDHIEPKQYQTFVIDQELKLLYHSLNFFFRNPTPTESPVEKVESWPLWEDLDKHYLEIDEFPTLR